MFVVSRSEARAEFHADVYDKMRVCLEREGCFVEATGYVVASYASLVRACHLGGRSSALGTLRAPEFFDARITPYLSRTRATDRLADLRALVDRHLGKLPALDVERLRHDTANLLVMPMEARKPTTARG